MKVRYSWRARAELEEIVDFIAQRDRLGAARVLRLTRDTVTLLEQFPRHGRKQREQGVRRLGAGRFPYVIYYHVDEQAKEVTILNNRHAARKRKHRDT
jgi:toxin ParE1/3/4